MKKLVKNQLFVLIIAVLTLVLFERTVPVVTLTDRAIVVAVGIDKEEDKFMLSAQIARPSRNDGSKGSTAYSVIKGKGNSLSQAIAEVSQNCSLNASLAHCNLVVIGEYLKEKGEYPNFERCAKELLGNKHLGQKIKRICKEGLICQSITFYYVEKKK